MTMTMKTGGYLIGFGKVGYAPGAPENLPRWAWACQCANCVNLPPALHGPFMTLQEARRDAELFFSNLDDTAEGGCSRSL